MLTEYFIYIQLSMHIVYTVIPFAFVGKWIQYLKTINLEATTTLCFHSFMMYFAFRNCAHVLCIFVSYHAVEWLLYPYITGLLHCHCGKIIIFWYEWLITESYMLTFYSQRTIEKRYDIRIDTIIKKNEFSTASDSWYLTRYIRCE